MKTIYLGPQGIGVLFEGDELELLRHLIISNERPIKVGGGRIVTDTEIETTLDRFERAFMDQMSTGPEDYFVRLPSDDPQSPIPSARPAADDDDEIPFGHQP